MKDSKTCGIYIIRNIVNGKKYVGSSITIEKRWIKHKCLLKCNKHNNRHLQRSYNKYGDIFEYTILEVCHENMLIVREDVWIAYYDSMNFTKDYNLISADSTIRSDGTKKLCQANRPKTLSEEHKKNIGLSGLGRIRQPLSQDVKDRIANKLRGVKRQPLSEETKKKFGESISRAKAMTRWNKLSLLENQSIIEFLGG